MGPGGSGELRSTVMGAARGRVFALVLAAALMSCASPAPATRPKPEPAPLVGGYARLSLDEEIVGRTVAVIRETLADCNGREITITEVLEAWSQVVAGRNIWLRARYTLCEPAGGAPEAARELSAIVYWNLQGEARLTDLDLDFTAEDARPGARELPLRPLRRSRFSHAGRSGVAGAALYVDSLLTRRAELGKSV